MRISIPTHQSPLSPLLSSYPSIYLIPFKLLQPSSLSPIKLCFFFVSLFLLLCSTCLVCIVYCIDTNAFSVCLDVGGGSVPNDTPHSLARIPLRWMIRECFLAKTVSLSLPSLLCIISVWV